MRLDAAAILAHLGYAIDKDFVAFQESRDSVAIKWLSAQPQPDDKAIDAAVLELATVEQAKQAQKVESDTARTQAKQAYSDLEPLLTHKDPAIALLAGVMVKHILATLGR